MERHLDKYLEKLKSRLIQMASLVEEQVTLSIKAWEENNVELAQIVSERDDKVDKYDLKIDKYCQKLFALNQPVAMDLRLIMSALTINTNLERIGDIAANIANAFIKLGKKPEFLEATTISSMGVVVREMMSGAITSFIEQNPRSAEKVIKKDELLNELNKENYKILIDLMKQNAEYIDDAVIVLMFSRYLERIGDHATNISEDVYFIVEAQLIRHNYEKLLFEEEE